MADRYTYRKYDSNTYPGKDHLSSQFTPAPEQGPPLEELQEWWHENEAKNGGGLLDAIGGYRNRIPVSPEIEVTDFTKNLHQKMREADEAESQSSGSSEPNDDDDFWKIVNPEG